jgi:hypothetical protein
VQRQTLAPETEVPGSAAATSSTTGSSPTSIAKYWRIAA